jgi:CheY-like chemotaxis protein
VRDTGVGIDPALLPTIFDLFVQADHTGFGGGGLGIGLALARQLVQMHGGHLEATSEGHGRGSEFAIVLPASCLAAQADARAAVAAVSEDGRPLRVLVVDDNDDSADMLAMMVGTWGHDARSAYDGASALEVADAFKPEVVLLDLGLPGLDGHAIAARLRAKPWAQRVTLFAVTGRGQDEDRQRSRDAGFHEHLVKPVVPETLQSMLARVGSVR